MSLLFNMLSAATATAKSHQMYPTLCDRIDSNPPGSPVPGILQQEHWSGLPLPSPMHESEKWKGSCSVMSDSATSWTAAYQAPLSIGFSRQEYWSGVSLTSLNMLSRLVIIFLPRSKRLLISWLVPQQFRGCGNVIKTDRLSSCQIVRWSVRTLSPVTIKFLFTYYDSASKRDKR